MDKLLYTSLIVLGFLAVSASPSKADITDTCTTVCEAGEMHCNKYFDTNVSEFNLNSPAKLTDAKAACAVAFGTCLGECVKKFKGTK